MTRSPTLLLRRLFGEPPTRKLPLGRLFRRAYVHAQYESGNLSDSCSVAIPGKQRAASWANFAILIKSQSLSWLRGREFIYPVALGLGRNTPKQIQRHPSALPLDLSLGPNFNKKLPIDE